MSSMDIVLTLVFSSVMLLFMSYPAMVLTNYLEDKFSLNEKWHSYRVIGLTILFSLLVGIFLRVA